MVSRAFFDTNVLVYAYDDTEPAKRKAALDLLANDKIDIVISAQILGEFFVTVTRKFGTPLSAEVAQEAVVALGEFEVAALTRNLVVDAVRTSIDHQLSYWDALVVETATRSGAETLYTEDLNAGSTLRGVAIVNPFAGL